MACRRLPEEVEAFATDKSSAAYDKAVDRLLASPHFGERMAVPWLDLARYADTEGYHGDQERPHWLFRDYVIHSFNENKPFNQFTTEQLAGDLLPKPAFWQKVASGYNRLGMTTAQKRRTNPKEYIAKYAADRVRTAGTLWLGGTRSAARNATTISSIPFSRDFYRLQAFFADVDEIPVGHQTPTMMLPVDRQAEVDKLDQRIATLKHEIDGPNAKFDAAQVAWEKAMAAQLPEWHLLEPASVSVRNGSKLKILDNS